jgi:hypothetical protein
MIKELLNSHHKMLKVNYRSVIYLSGKLLSLQFVIFNSIQKLQLIIHQEIRLKFTKLKTITYI